MGEHANAARMRRAAEAAGAGDIPTFLDAFSTSCTWRVPGNNPLAGVLRGHEGIQQFFGRLMEGSKGTFRPGVEESLGSDDHVVIFLRLTADGPDGPVDTRIAHFATVDEAGKFEKNWWLPSDTGAMDRLLS
jgi:ketosteroid isomerase-like protein